AQRKRYDEARQIIQTAMREKPEEAIFQQLALLAREDLTPQQRDEATVNLITTESDAFKRALDLMFFHIQRNDLAKALVQIDAAEKHLLDKDTPMARDATTSQHHALLKTKLRVAGQLKDES